MLSSASNLDANVDRLMRNFSCRGELGYQQELVRVSAARAVLLN